MTDEAISATMKQWQDAMSECELRMDQLSELTGHVVESPLGDAVYRLMGAYTETVADLIGCPNEYLLAWWTDRNFGTKPMRIGFFGEPMLTIETIEQLAAFIAEDLRRSA